MVEYRPVPEERDAEFERLLGYAFSPYEGPQDEEPGADHAEDDEREAEEDDDPDFGDRRGMFDGEQLVVGCKHVDFEARVRGEWLPMAGLAAVASPPEHRRRGYVRRLIAESLAEYRERDQPIAALWPFERSFYARYGWATACRYTKATVPPEALAVAAEGGDGGDRDGGARGEFHRVDPGSAADVDRLNAVYERWLDGHALATRRSEAWWRNRVLGSFGQQHHAYRWERDGDSRGYVVYDVEEGDGFAEHTLRVGELAAVDHEAFLALLSFCRNHDSQVAEIEAYGHGLDRLLDVVVDHDDLTVETLAGPMVRIVDVPAALAAIDYDGVDDAAVTLAVEDDAAEWNDGTFELRVEGGTATVRETDADPDARVRIGTLSQLLVGYLSVERARRVGELAVHEPDAAETLATLFPECEVFLPDGF